MKIILDLQGAQSESRYRGIGRYTVSLAKAIVSNRGDHEVFIVLNGLLEDSIEYIRSQFYNLLPQSNILVWNSLGPTSFCVKDNDWRRKIAEIIRNALFEKIDGDVIHMMTIFEGYADNAVTSITPDTITRTLFATVFDLIPFLNKEEYLNKNVLYNNFYIKTIQQLQHPDAYLTISESSKKEAVEHLLLPTENIFNTSLACDEVFIGYKTSPSHSNIIKYKFNIFQPYIFYTGGGDPRKNLKRLINAYSILPQNIRDSHQLVFGGKMPDSEISVLKTEAIKSGLRKADLLFTGYVTDEELAMLYGNCKLFVFPSWHEGFGLPLLEAMACGAPVIASNASSIPEVIDLDDALFDPFDITSIKSKILNVLNNENYRKQLIQHGHQRSKTFSWDASAKVAIAAFEKIYSKKTTESIKFNESNLIEKIVQNIPPDISNNELLLLSQHISDITTLNNNVKNIYIDISELIQRDARTGIQRVTRSILASLLSHPPEGYSIVPVFATNKIQGYSTAWEFTFTKIYNEAFNESDNYIQFNPKDTLLILDLQHHIAISQFEYLKTLRNKGTSIFFVVYDLLPILQNKMFPPEAGLFHKQWLDIVTFFDGAACISKSVANELDNYILNNKTERLRPFRNSFFHLGADIAQSLPSRGLPEDGNSTLSQISKHTAFLSVGTIEPRKGHAQILSSFNELWRKGLKINLVFVGKYGWNTEELVKTIQQHPLLNKHLFWLNGISDEYLEKVYEHSKCLIAASEGEGFGLPLIEAAQHKIPIIARDIPVFKEVAGQHAHYFSGNNVQNLANTIEEWLDLFAANAHPLSDTMPHLTWNESAAQLMACILPIEST